MIIGEGVYLGRHFGVTGFVILMLLDVWWTASSWRRRCAALTACSARTMPLFPRLPMSRSGSLPHGGYRGAAVLSAVPMAKNIGNGTGSQPGEEPVERIRAYDLLLRPFTFPRSISQAQ